MGEVVVDVNVSQAQESNKIRSALRKSYKRLNYAKHSSFILATHVFRH